MIALLPGDGIGPEIMAEAVKIIEAIAARDGLRIATHEGLIGGAAIDQTGTPLPDDTLKLCKKSHATLLAAVGGPKWENLPQAQKPEAGLLALRKGLKAFANLRPAKIFPALASASTLKHEVVEGVDILVVRELTGGIYFGKPRKKNETKASNTMVYSKPEIERIAKVAFDIARARKKKVCSVDKANVLEVSQLWREVVTEVGKNYSDVQLSHMYVDNCAMQLVRNPSQFDVIVTENLFGDILSDEAAMLTGSIGMLPSASMGESGKGGIFEPVHGSAPDIAGQQKANPYGMILSVAMMFRHALGNAAAADTIEKAVEMVLAEGLRTPDIYSGEGRIAATSEIGTAVAQAIQRIGVES